MNNKDIILINDYYLENDKLIKLSPISIIEKLTDEKLFILLENNQEISNKYLWGKILAIDTINKIIIIMDQNRNVLKIKNIKNDIKLGQFCLFSNYIINIETNVISLNKDSFCYFSSQEIYFSKKIELNSYSVIQFYFLDYKIDDNNAYKAVKIQGEVKAITSDKMIFVIKHKKIKNYELYVETITLLEENYLPNGQDFKVFIMQGFINKINTFINYKSKFSYYYEYLYYSYKDFDFLKTKTIEINDIKKIISIYDDFYSKNRRRFNILNIPFQNECKKEELGDINSILICETFFKSPQESKIFGIFNINEILYNIPIIQMNNNVFDKYYDIFGFIFDYLKMNQNNKEAQDNFISECGNKFNENIKELSKYLI